MTPQKSILKKTFIWIALIAICITVISPFALYFWAEFMNNNNCEEWYVRNETTQMCEEEVTDEGWDTEILDTQEKCEAQSWTWYEANNVCILPEAQ